MKRFTPLLAVFLQAQTVATEDTLREAFSDLRALGDEDCIGTDQEIQVELDRIAREIKTWVGKEQKDQKLDCASVRGNEAGLTVDRMFLKPILSDLFCSSQAAQWSATAGNPDPAWIPTSISYYCAKQDIHIELNVGSDKH